MNKKVKPIHYLYYLILMVFAFIQTFPFYLKVISSLQHKDFLPIHGKLYLWPEKISFENYAVAWEMADLGRGYMNSLIYVSIFTAISAVIMILVGYVLAKKKFRGSKLIFIMLLSTMMVPGEILLIPNFLLLRDLHLLNKLAGLIIPGLINIFGIFLAKQFISTIPDSVLESAHLDGASELTIIRKIIFPLSGPVIGTYVIITFTGMWNDYLWPMIILSKSDVYPVQLSLMTFKTAFATSYDGTLQSAGMIMTLLPVVIVFMIFQRRFVEGISLTGIK